MNRAAFFHSIRSSLFGGKLTQGVVDTTEAILDECKNSCITDYRIIAYLLATAYWESYSKQYNPDWLPVREGYTKSNNGAIKAVTNLFKAKKVSRNYALPAANGHSYYGRGLVQITLADNYDRLGRLIGVDLYNNPDKALELPVSVQLLVHGVLNGWYTGRALTQYITPAVTDFLGSRKTVNGTDRAAEIAAIALKFYNGMIIL